jgi:hypothetical protein
MVGTLHRVGLFRVARPGDQASRSRDGVRGLCGNDERGGQGSGPGRRVQFPDGATPAAPKAGPDITILERARTAAVLIAIVVGETGGPDWVTWRL